MTPFTKHLLLLASGALQLTEATRVTSAASMSSLAQESVEAEETAADSGDDSVYCSRVSSRCKCTMTKVHSGLLHPNSPELLDIYKIPTKNVVFYTTGLGYYGLMAHIRTTTTNTSEKFRSADFNCVEIGEEETNAERCHCTTGGAPEDSNVKHCMADASSSRSEQPMCVAKTHFIRCYVGPNGEDDIGWTEYIKLGWTRPPFQISEEVLSRRGLELANVAWCEPWEAHDDTRHIFCEWKPKGADSLPKDMEALKEACKDAVPHRGKFGARIYDVESMTCGRTMKLEKCIGLHAVVDDRMVQEEIEGTPMAFEAGADGNLEGDISKPCRGTSERCKCTMIHQRQQIPHPHGFMDPFNIKVQNAVLYMTGAGYKALGKKVVQDKHDGKLDYTRSFNCNEIDETAEDKTRCSCASAQGVSSQNVQRCLACVGTNAEEGCENTCVEEVDYLRCYKYVTRTTATKMGWTRSPFNVPAKVMSQEFSKIAFCEPWLLHDERRNVWCHWKPINADMLDNTTESLKSACKAAVPNRGMFGGFNHKRAYYQRSMTCAREMKLEKCITKHAILDKRFIADEVEGTSLAVLLNDDDVFW